MYVCMRVYYGMVWYGMVWYSMGRGIVWDYIYTRCMDGSVFVWGCTCTSESEDT